MSAVFHTDGLSRIHFEAMLEALIGYHRRRLDTCPSGEIVRIATRIVLLHAARRLSPRGLAVLERLALTHGQSAGLWKLARAAAGGNSVCSTAGGPIFGWRL